MKVNFVSIETWGQQITSSRRNDKLNDNLITLIKWLITYQRENGMYSNREMEHHQTLGIFYGHKSMSIIRKPTIK